MMVPMGGGVATVQLSKKPDNLKQPFLTKFHRLKHSLPSVSKNSTESNISLGDCRHIQICETTRCFSEYSLGEFVTPEGFSAILRHYCKDRGEVGVALTSGWILPCCQFFKYFPVVI